MSCQIGQHHLAVSPSKSYRLGRGECRLKGIWALIEPAPGWNELQLPEAWPLWHPMPLFAPLVFDRRNLSRQTSHRVSPRAPSLRSLSPLLPSSLSPSLQPPLSQQVWRQSHERRSIWPEVEVEVVIRCWNQMCFALGRWGLPPPPISRLGESVRGPSHQSEKLDSCHLDEPSPIAGTGLMSIPLLLRTGMAGSDFVTLWLAPKGSERRGTEGVLGVELVSL